MRHLRTTYGFKGPEREESLRKSMSANHDKVSLEFYFSTLSFLFLFTTCFERAHRSPTILSDV